MQVGTYSDGRPLNYDETSTSFDVGGTPVTPADVVGYDQAGQVEWLSDDLKSWARTLASGQAPAAQAPETNPSPTEAAQTRKGLFGFRSRQPWKMVVASAYYLFAVAIAIGSLIIRKPYSTNGTDIALEVLSGLVLSLALLSPAFLLSDFGYRNRLPLFKRRKVVWSALGLALFLVLMLVTSAFAATLHTQPYKVAAAAEIAAQEKEAATQRAAEEAKRAAEASATAAAEAKTVAEEASAAAEALRVADAKKAAEASATAEAQRLADANKAAETSAAAAAQKPAPTPAPAPAQPAPPTTTSKAHPFDSPSSFSSGTPERVVAEFISAWKARNWDKMAGWADAESRNRESDLAGQLRAQYDFKTLKGFEIQKVVRVSNVAADVTYAIWYDSEFSGLAAKVVKAKVLKMTSDGTLSAGGKWGVNPISVLRENDY